MSENSTSLSLFQQIAAAVDGDGQLPKNFSLPKEKTKNKLMFADGALDGIKLYHTQPQPVSVEPLCEALEAINAGQTEAGTAQAEAFLEQHGVIEVIDELHKWIVSHHEQISPQVISGFAIRAVMTSEKPEMVKLGLAVLELLNTERQPELKKVIRVLALSDEFTLFCLFIMRSWSSANDEIFDLAQKVRGWGRIHAVNQLEPSSRLIRKWLLDHGCENTVAPAYSALTVANKCNLIEQLQQPQLSEADWKGAGLILDGLMAEGPVAGISQFEAQADLFNAYLDAAASQPQDLRVVQNVIAVAQYIDNDKVKLPEIRQRCLEFLNSSACYLTVSQAMENGRGFEEAVKLSIPMAEKAWTWIQKDPVANCMSVRYLMQAEAHVDELLELYEASLPLEMMASGPSDELGLGKDYQHFHALAAIVQALQLYPGKGEVFLKCALLCPVISCRTHALDTLESWVKLSTLPLSELSAPLMVTLAQAEILEIRPELTARIQALQK